MPKYPRNSHVYREKVNRKHVPATAGYTSAVGGARCQRAHGVMGGGNHEPCASRNKRIGPLSTFCRSRTENAPEGESRLALHPSMQFHDTPTLRPHHHGRYAPRSLIGDSKCLSDRRRWEKHQYELGSFPLHLLSARRASCARLKIIMHVTHVMVLLSGVWTLGES